MSRRRRLRIVSILGSRPEVIQAAALHRELRHAVEEILVHTGQHFDPAMHADQISDTRLPEPAYNLGVGGRGGVAVDDQVALGQARIGEVLDAERPDAVLVRGDTTATLAGARAARERDLPLIHVEAGLRSYRDDMPEERSRIETDHLSTLLAAPTAHAAATLEAEGVSGEVHVTGDVLCDMLLACRDRLPPSGERGAFALATVHRNYNVDDDARLAAVLACLARVPCRVVFPVHPRTRGRLGGSFAVPANVELREPVPYTQMLALERAAQMIVTDSGGVQREAYMWGVPCLTLREETEWVETVETGWNALCGVDPDRVTAALSAPLPQARPPIFGDGTAAQRIAEVVVAHIGERMLS